MIPHLTQGDDKRVYVHGEFEFEKSSTLFYDIENASNPYLTFTFKWNPEFSTADTELSEDDLIELVAEKIKQDFIKMCQQKNNK